MRLSTPLSLWRSKYSPVRAMQLLQMIEQHDIAQKDIYFSFTEDQLIGNLRNKRLSLPLAQKPNSLPSPMPQRKFFGGRDFSPPSALTLTTIRPLPAITSRRSASSQNHSRPSTPSSDMSMFIGTGFGRRSRQGMSNCVGLERRICQQMDSRR